MRLQNIPIMRVSLATMLAVTAASCANYAEDCARNRTCPGFSGPGSTGSGGTAGPCVPGPEGSGAELTNDCGIFVAKWGDDLSGGSMLAPVATLAKALDLAVVSGKNRVYACAQEFQEAISIPAGVSLYGGLDCVGSWRYVGDTTKTVIAPTADMVPLTLLGGGGITNVADVEARALDATLPGGSSIAAIADGTQATLVRVRLVAGTGRDGDNGTTPDPIGPTDPTDPAIKGSDGTAACTIAAETPGGEGKSNRMCATSIGGKGGSGMELSGTAGADGQPLPDPNPDLWGLGGAGAAGGTCKPGGPGRFGSDGAPGAGGSMLGMLSATGITGASGASGEPGTPGQGGGGGGGAKGKAGCAGASGGGGGAGGCGGPGGLGGQAGGSSIALISVNASLTLTYVTMKVSTGGKGGDGADGQNGSTGGLGGLGGAPSAGTLKGCSGGEGGVGGFGGKGGGGRGGHAIGLAFTSGSPPAPTSSFTVEPGVAGLGGAGVDSNGMGTPGIQAESQEF